MGLIGNIYGFLGFYNHSRRKTEKALRWYERQRKMMLPVPITRWRTGYCFFEQGSMRKPEKYSIRC